MTILLISIFYENLTPCFEMQGVLHSLFPDSMSILLLLIFYENFTPCLRFYEYFTPCFTPPHFEVENFTPALRIYDFFLLPVLRINKYIALVLRINEHLLPF